MPGQNAPHALRAELAGAVLVFALGSALHFTYDWLGAWPPAAIVAAVNESVWEHLKIAFWPGLLWAVLRSLGAHRASAAHWGARGIGLLCVSLVIVLVFRAYTGAVGHNILAVDITLFGAAIVLGHVAYLACVAPMRRSRALRALGLAVLVAQIAAFAAFTHFPPTTALFEDSRNSRFGLEAHQAPTPGAAR